MTIPNSTINVNPLPDSVDGKYSHGTPVYLTAVAAPGESFLRWSGDVTGSFTSSFIYMTGNKQITASFLQQRYGLITKVMFSV
jgi:hypothetical protein